MSERQADSTTPTLEVRILRDGVVIQRELCETDQEVASVNVVTQSQSYTVALEGK